MEQAERNPPSKAPAGNALITAEMKKEGGRWVDALTILGVPPEDVAAMAYISMQVIRSKSRRAEKSAQPPVVVTLEILAALAPYAADFCSHDQGYYMDVADEIRKVRRLLVSFFRYSGIAYEIPEWPPSSEHLKLAVTAAVKTGKLPLNHSLDLLEGLGLPTSIALGPSAPTSGSPA